VKSVPTESRSKNMRAIRGRDTRPELMLRRYLFHRGFRYRVNDRQLPGNPDVVLKRYCAVIFVHGCYWHRHAACPNTATPKSNVDFWNKKFEENRERDRRNVRSLLQSGWRVLIAWECGLSKADEATATRTMELAVDWLVSGDVFCELSRDGIRECGPSESNPRTGR
jgi:DNA mismatch endonuclease (patch repair protein)